MNRHSSHAAQPASITGTPSPGPGLVSTPWRASLSTLRLSLPTAYVRSANDAPGMQTPKAPLSITSSRVKVLLSIMHAIHGGYALPTTFNGIFGCDTPSSSGGGNRPARTLTWMEGGSTRHIQRQVACLSHR